MCYYTKKNPLKKVVSGSMYLQMGGTVNKSCIIEMHTEI